jgi:hypothetical protein
MSNHRAVEEAERYAYMLRRSGYPEAKAAPQYCIDENDGSFYTFTVCVELGPHKPKTMKPSIRKAMEIAKARLGFN